MLGPSIFGALGKFLGKLLFGTSTPASGRTPPRQPPKPPTRQQLEIMPPAYEERGLVPVSNTSQNSYAAEHSRLLGILKNELLGLKNQMVPKDGQRRRRRGKLVLPPETTRQDPRPTENVTSNNMPTYHSGMATKTGKMSMSILHGSALSIFDSWEAITAASKISGISAT